MKHQDLSSQNPECDMDNNCTSSESISVHVIDVLQGHSQFNFQECLLMLKAAKREPLKQKKECNDVRLIALLSQHPNKPQRTIAMENGFWCCLRSSKMPFCCVTALTPQTCQQDVMDVMDVMPDSPSNTPSAAKREVSSLLTALRCEMS